MFSFLQVDCLLRKGNRASHNSEVINQSLGNHEERGNSSSRFIRKISEKWPIRVSLGHIRIPELITVIKVKVGRGGSGGLGLEQKHTDGAVPTKEQEGSSQRRSHRGQRKPRETH